ncbi:MAG: T9SS type A sorting domain-containing protein [Chitinophagaceae bacterium]|nr:T9SS type A sorting domain-containing protein [Chitinophagaceae bacterium]
MINKLSIFKNILVIITCFSSCIYKSQTPASNSTPDYFSGNYTSGTQNNAAGNAILNPVTISGAANYDMKAHYSIGVLPGSSAANISTGSFGLHIESSILDIVSYHANGFSNIPLYDKFELGIKLPEVLTQKVNNFFGPYKATPPLTPQNNGYGCNFDLANGNINPYDPDQISVEATFNFPGKLAQTIYGFYYREYSYNIDPNVTTPTYANADWIENLNLQYHWRVRFTPKYIGTYNVTWVIRGANNAILYQDNIGQNFTTTSSSSLGFIKMGTNKKFFVTQPDPNQPEKSILPIGLGCATPRAAIPVGLDPLPTTDCADWGSPDVQYPSRYWEHYNLIKTRIAEQGANFTRLFSTPSDYDIEWENLNIYDAKQDRPIQNNTTNTGPITPSEAASYGFHATWGKDFSTVTKYKGTNRQAIMWEFDRLLDMAKTSTDSGKPLYFQWGTSVVQDGFQIGQGVFNWSENPYFSLTPSQNPNNVIEFFTDMNIRKIFKKRIRYMIARYGYSTNIADFELFNEFHFLKDAMGGGTAVLNVVFKPWLEDILDYIRNPTYLNHSDHLFTVSYEPGQGFGGDNVPTLNNLDFLSTHPYVYTSETNGDHNTFKKAANAALTFSVMYNKPSQAGEMGISPDWSGVNRAPAGTTMFTEFVNPTFHSLLWSTTFTGGLTSGLDCWHHGLELDPNNTNPSSLSNPSGPYPQAHSCGDGYVQHFKPLQAFIKDINFDHDRFFPGYFTTGDQGIEAYYLINNDANLADQVIGYVRNRTFWWSNFSNSASGPTFYDPNIATNYYELYNVPDVNPNPSNPVTLPSTQPVTSGNLGPILIQKLIPGQAYVVDWYNTYIDPAVANPIISTSPLFIAPPNGICYISPPTFSSSDCHLQEFGFKIHPYGAQKLVSGNSNLIPSVPENMDESIQIQVYPNPSNGVFNIKYSNDVKVISVNVIDNMGRVIKTINNKPSLIDMSNYTNGIYQLQFKTEKTIVSKKIELSN